MLKSTRCREEEDSLLTVKRRRRIMIDVKGVIEQPCSIFNMEERSRRMNDVKLLALAKRIFMEKHFLTSMNKGLPSDLWLDIFLRTPPADLFSLKAVCKTFHQLISSDWFVGMHLKDFTKYSKPTAAIIISTDPTASNLIYNPDKRTISVSRRDDSRFDYLCTHHSIDSPLPSIRPCHRVIDSYLGRLLVQICDRLLLCNPITESYLFLPSISGFSLDFRCLKIAYDDVSEQYKVFGLKIWDNKVSLYVFDVLTDGKSHLPARKTTTYVEVDFDRTVTYDRIEQSIVVNGNVYWLITTKDRVREPRWGCIVSANVTTEEVKTRVCASHPYPWSLNTNFFVANGTFYFNEGGELDYEFELWVLEGVESGNPLPYWKKKHDISTTSILPSPYFHIRALGMFRDKLLIVILPSQQYYQYDLSREEFDKVMVARSDDIERELIGDDTTCQMSMGPVDIATQVRVGFIPSTIL